jgi:hypothetical protein
MISDILPKLTIPNVLGALFGLLVLIHIFQRLRYRYRFYRAGNVAAPKMANDPVTGK